MTVTAPPDLSSIPNLTFNGLLKQCALNGIGFPVEDVNDEFIQNVVEHKYPHVQTPTVEPMGIVYHRFHVKAMFLNGAFRQKFENWGELYPTVFQKVYQTLLNPNNPVIVFTHPTLGDFNVRVVRGATRVSPQQKNGQTIDFELVETDSLNEVNNLTQLDTVATGDAAARAFDGDFATYRALVQNDIDKQLANSVKKISLTDLMTQVRAAADTTTLQITRLQHVTSNALYQVQQVQDSFRALNDAATAGMSSELERVKAAVYELQGGQARFKNKTGTFIVNVPMSLSQVLLAVRPFNPTLTIESLIQTNPTIVSQGPLIPQGTTITYSL